MELKYKIQQALNKTTDRKSFIQELLVNTLNWPIPSFLTDLDDMSYEWSDEDLNAAGLTEKSLSGPVLQMQKIVDNQPWGIFILEFENPDIFITGRGLTTPLRKVLRGLIPKRQRSSKLPAWDRENLLFICTHDYKYFRFAYFKPAKEKGQAEPLAIFGWEGGDAPRTVCEFNLGHLEWPTDSEDSEKWTSEWSKAFDVEKVTNKFYEEYKKLFDAIQEKFIGLTEQEEKKLFAQTLLNRLMFLRFVERKGWLKLDGNPHNYLQRLYQTCSGISQSWYQNRLKVLFFEGLAVPNHGRNEIIGDVPYLNGGLFETTDLDNEVTDIPNEAFEPILGQEGLFYRYNFTIEESTPLDIEVAVDPEMLGKVFEKLVTGRHETGSYYTPRPIVSFMCREALKGFLNAKTSASPEAIAKLVDEQEISADLTNKHAEEILFYLETIKAVDPACGSGAYLLGLLQELIEIRKALQNQQLKSDPDFIYKLKLLLISHCLYGVDIDPFATNIAKLRLWLSLAVESERPQPLPNLDFKIETGDSILGPCDAFADRPDALVMSKLRQRAQQLVLKKDQYMLAHGEEKQKLHAEILTEENEIANETGTVVGEGIIAWHVHFAEVFMPGRRIESTFDGKFGFVADAQPQRTFKVTQYEPGGFDIVLTNPPYVEHKRLKYISPVLKANFTLYVGSADLYVYFYERGFDLLKNGGVLTFISSNKFIKTSYGQKLRKLLSTNELRHIIDFTKVHVFDALVASCIVIVSKKPPRTIVPVTFVDDSLGDFAKLSDFVLDRHLDIKAETLNEEIWQLENSINLRLKSKIEAGSKRLCEFDTIGIYRGVTTGCNEAFVIDTNRRKQLIEEAKESKAIIKTLLQGRNIRKWIYVESEQFFIFTRRGININEYPAIKRHLSQYKPQLEPGKGRKPGSYNWYEIQDNTAYYPEFEKEKIIWGLTADKWAFAYDDKKHYLPSNGYILTSENIPLKYILALLNSKIMEFYFGFIGIMTAGGAFTLKHETIGELPIKEIPAAEQKPFVNIVDKILSITKSTDYFQDKSKQAEVKELEKQIDQMVYALYGLTADEIAIVEGHSKTN